MIAELFERKEKKVEYVELIYDLIFVYVIGRNNQLLHHFDGGFVELKTFFAYALCTLAVIQIWSFTTFYINMFGRNGARDYVFMFINMYLLYFIGESTRNDWHAFQAQYHIAWGLILVNIGVQYLLELRNHRGEPYAQTVIKRMCIALFCEAAIVIIAAFPNALISTILFVIAILCGIILTSLSRRGTPCNPVDFTHLSERIMLYVVFTFGEMIIAVASYFNGNGGWIWSNIYFSLMAFLIVVGLFLSYGFMYDNLIDREGSYDGMLYMIIHILIIYALNNITASLEFMREKEVALIPKILFLVGSLVAYFGFLLLLKGYTKCTCKPTKAFLFETSGATLIFVLLMLLLRKNMFVNILISVIYVFAVFLIFYSSNIKNIKNKEINKF